MNKVNQIVKGTINNILNRKEDLFNKRIQICRVCPLYKKDSILGEMCNPSLYINKNGDVQSFTSDGFIKGCGCILNSKCRVEEAACIVNKW